MKTHFGWLLLVLVGGCSPQLVDPCANVSGTCLTVQVDSSSTVSQVDSLAVQLSGGGLDESPRSVENGSLSLPVAIGLAIAQLSASPSTITVTVSGQTGGVTATGSVTAMIASGEHQTVLVQLGASGDGGSGADACTPTVTSCPATQVCGKIPDGCNGFVDCGPCQLLSLSPSIANAGATVTLEGTFNADAMVQFPGAAAQAVTVLGPHRATTMVPAAATAGDLTLTTAGTTVGPLPFRRVPFALGIGPFFANCEQANYGRLMSALTTPRTGASAVVTGPDLYLIGGDANATIERALVNADGSLGGFVDAGIALTTSRTGASTVIVGSSVYVMGGDATGSIERATIASDGTLGAPTDAGVTLSTPRQGHASLIVGNWLYVLGGTSSGAAVGSVERAPINGDGSLGTFSTVAAAITPRAGHTVSLVGNTVFVVGGSNGATPVGSVQAATIDGSGNVSAFSDTGTTLQATRHFAVVLGPSLYVGGGGLTTVQKGSVSGSAISFSSAGSALATARSGAATAVLGNYLYALGGDTSGTALATVERATVDVSGNLSDMGFTKAAATPSARYDHNSVVIGRYLYFIGGEVTGPLGTVERATIAPDGSLSSFSDAGVALTVPRYNAAAVVAGGYLYVIGGYAASGRTTSVERASIQSDGTLGAFADAGTGLMTPRGTHRAFFAGHSLYVVGGDQGAVESAVLRDDGTVAAGFANVTGVALTAQRAFPTVAVLGSHVYVIAGNVGGTYVASVDVGTLSGAGALSGFSNASVSLIIGRGDQASMAVGNRLYVIGGATVSNDLAEIESAPINLDGSLGAFTQTSGIVLPTGRAGLTAELLLNSLFAIGGYDGTGLGLLSVATLQ
jgi:hypothetical protein